MELVDLTDQVEARLGPAGTAQVAEWELVLTAVGIRHRVRPVHGKWRLLVPEDRTRAALDQILAYERENLPEESADLDRPRSNAEPTIMALLLLLGFSMVTDMSLPGFGHRVIPWHILGRVDASAVAQGEWWRAVTGLTLHADAAHLLGNLVIGGYFIVHLCRRLGSGAGWLVVMLSGTLGNLINVWIRGVPHHSIGASTAVFGALAALGAVRVMDEQAPDLFRRLSPLAAGAALLSMLGTGGERTDLLAHLFGFGVGCLLGVAAGATLKEGGLRRQGVQMTCGTTAAVLPIWCWYLALRAGP